MPVVVVATMTAKPESVDTVRDACKQAIEEVHGEPGCELYSLHEANGTFVFVEQWADEEALKTHSTAPAIGKLFGAIGEHLDGAPDIKMLAAGCRGRSGQGPAARVTGVLQGKVAFITGAARGQGRAHAVKLASEGADIIAVDLCDQIASVPYPMATPDDLAATVKLVEETGARIVALEADVRDRDSLKTALRTGTAELGDRLDIVIANAGIAPMAGEDAWQDVIDVNLTGVYNTVDVAMRPMIKFGNGGSIVLTSSVIGPGGSGLADCRFDRLCRCQTRHRRAHAGVRESIGAVQHPSQLRAPGRGEHADDRQRLHPVLAGRYRAGDAGRPRHGQRAAGADARARGHRQRGVLAGRPTRAATSHGVTLPVDAGYVNKR